MEPDLGHGAGRIPQDFRVQHRKAGQSDGFVDAPITDRLVPRYLQTPVNTAITDFPNVVLWPRPLKAGRGGCNGTTTKDRGWALVRHESRLAVRPDRRHPVADHLRRGGRAGG